MNSHITRAIYYVISFGKRVYLDKPFGLAYNMYTYYMQAYHLPDWRIYYIGDTTIFGLSYKYKRKVSEKKS